MSQIGLKTPKSNHEMRIRLINLAIASARYGSVDEFIEIEQIGEKPAEIPPTMHLFLHGPMESLRSWTFKYIREYCESREIPIAEAESITVPGLIGGLDLKSRVPNLPLPCRAIRGVTMIDEFNVYPGQTSHIFNALNKILTEERYSKKYNLAPKKPIIFGPPKYEFEGYIGGGYLGFRKLRSVWMFSTNKNPNVYPEDFRSRVIPISHYFSRDEKKSMLENREIIFKGNSVSSVSKRIITREEYNMIMEYTEKHPGIPKGLLIRPTNDLLRCYVMSGYKIDEDLFSYVLDQHKFFYGILQEVNSIGRTI